MRHTTMIGVVTYLACMPLSRGSTATAQPAQRTLFVANNVSDTISVFTVETDGTLTEIAGSPFAAGQDTQALALSPDGQFLAATNAGLDKVEQLLLYSVGATGALTLLPGNPFFTGDGPLDLDMGPGGFVYSPCAGDDQFRVFEIEDGMLFELPSSPYNVANFPLEVDTAHDGRFVYTSHLFGNLVSGFEVQPNGDLQPLTGSPFQLPLNSGAFEIKVSPDNRNAYVGLGLSNAVAGVHIQADGTLTNIAGSPFASGATSAVNLAINPAGTFVFVVHVVSDGVTTMARDAEDGALTLVPGSFRDIGSDARKVVADERFVYVTDESTIDPGVGVMVYSYDKSGLMTLVPGSPFAAGSRPQDMELFVPIATGDFDGDGDVDLDDYVRFPSCLAGPADCASKDCLRFDFDQDCDVDMNDYGRFVQLFTGPL